MTGREDDDELQALQRAWRAMAGAWGLSDHEAKMLLPDGGADAPQPPHCTERRMRLLVQIDYLLHFDDEDTMRVWLRGPLPGLAGASPLEVLAGPTEELSRVRVLLETGSGS